MANDKRGLYLDREQGKFLGVCAGVAAFIGVAPWVVRLLLIAAVLLGAWFMIPVYFVAWLLLNEGNHRELAQKVNESAPVRHLKNVDYRKGLYRNREKGWVLGVCAGIADYLEVQVFWVRLITVIVMFLSGFVALLAYIIAYFVLNDAPAPRVYSASPEAQRQQDSLDETLRSSREDIKRCAHRFESLQRRLNRMEAYVTSSRFRWQREFRKL